MNHKGFTLIEILIVLLILGILVNLAISTIKGATIKAKLGQMFTDVSHIERTLIYLNAEGALGKNLAFGFNRHIDEFGEYFHVDVPEENDYFWYGIWIKYDAPYAFIQVNLKPSQHPSGYNALCQRYVFFKDFDDGYTNYKKGDRFWYVYEHEWSKYLKPLLRGDIEPFTP